MGSYLNDKGELCFEYLVLCLRRHQLETINM